MLMSQNALIVKLNFNNRAALQNTIIIQVNSVQDMFSSNSVCIEYIYIYIILLHIDCLLNLIYIPLSKINALIKIITLLIVLALYSNSVQFQFKVFYWHDCLVHMQYYQIIIT